LFALHITNLLREFDEGDIISYMNGMWAGLKVDETGVRSSAASTAAYTSTNQEQDGHCEHYADQNVRVSIFISPGDRINHSSPILVPQGFHEIATHFFSLLQYGTATCEQSTTATETLVGRV
jgi:hypothetical protein